MISQGFDNLYFAVFVFLVKPKRLIYRVDSNQKIQPENQSKKSSENQCDIPKERRPRQVEEDYPELGDWGGMKGPKSLEYEEMKRHSTGLNGISPLNQSQYISRRLKLDLRNECEIPIAGMFHHTLTLYLS